MATGLQGLLASLLNPNPGDGGLLSNAGYLQSTGLGPQQMARYQQMSGMGAQPASGAPSAPAMAPQAPTQPDQMQTASTAPSGGGIGDFLGNLFAPKSAQRNKTVQLLMQDGLDEGTATLVAQDKQSLNHYLRQRAFGEGQQPSEFQERAAAAQQYGLSGDEAQRFVLTGDLGGESQSLVNVGKGRLYDPNTKQFITAPDMGTDAPTVQTFYDEQGLPYNAEWNAETREWVKVGGSKAPSGMSLRTNPDGTVEFAQGTGAGQKLTEAQSKDVTFYTRGADADNILSGIDTQLTDWAQQNADKLPLGLGNYARSPEFRQAKQAADSFLTAILRKDTGAAITNQEFEIYGPMFLPAPGDDPATMEQKRRARQVALMAIKSGLGTAEAIAEANKIRLGIPGDAPIPPTGRDRHGPRRQPVVIDGYTIEEVE